MKKKLKEKIVGRKNEKIILQQLFESNKSEFLAVYGRRRVGKTFLIRNFYGNVSCVFFRCTGIQGGSLKEQLEQFFKQLGETFYGGAQITPRTRWLDAFDDLTKAINQVLPKKRIVIFFDEFPWMATKRSGLLKALEYYWNHYWSTDPRIRLIVCGSSASWIIKKIINNKGGLYNRVTRTMRLTPFTLHETKEFLESNGVKLNQRHILDLYMVFGGIPHYLSLIRRGLTAHQCIDELLFQRGGALVDEFDRLFASLFNESETHLAIVKTLARHRYGMGLAQLIQESGLASGGRTTQRLDELEEAGFIMRFLPHGHQEKGIFIKIVDEFTFFYLNWLKPHLSSIRKQDKNQGFWLSLSKSPSWRSWAGYAFETVCHKHLQQIRQALKIEIGSEVGSWRYSPRSLEEGSGAQIDLLFDRPDGAITICEIKYNERPFAIDKEYAANLKKKVEIYQEQTKTHKQIFISMITSGGLKDSVYSNELISQEADLDDLFAE